MDFAARPPNAMGAAGQAGAGVDLMSWCVLDFSGQPEGGFVFRFDFTSILRSFFDCALFLDFFLS